MSLVGFKAQNHAQQVLVHGPRSHVDDRATTPEDFAVFDKRFGFTLDAAASIENAKCGRFYTAEQDGLTRAWGGYWYCDNGEPCLCNCHYSSDAHDAARSAGREIIGSASPSATPDRANASTAIANGREPAKRSDAVTLPSRSSSEPRNSATPAPSEDEPCGLAGVTSTTTSDASGERPFHSLGLGPSGSAAYPIGNTAAPTVGTTGLSSKTTSFPSPTPTAPALLSPTCFPRVAPATAARARAPHGSGWRPTPTCAQCDTCSTQAERVFVNPPYSSIEPWVEKAHGEHAYGAPELIVMLLPANRTEQGWWQRQIEPQRLAGEIRVEFLPGRLRFLKPGQKRIAPNERPPFGCCLVIWGNVDGPKTRTARGE